MEKIGLVTAVCNLSSLAKYRKYNMHKMVVVKKIPVQHCFGTFKHYYYHNDIYSIKEKFYLVRKP